MSKRHLAKGSQEPPMVPGKWRVYSMEYCPFAHRARLVLALKKVPHDVVNVNLREKPEWLFQYNKEGKVPVLNTGDRIVTESLDIMDFLDQEFPEPPLWPSDESRKAKDKELIQQFGKVIPVWIDLIKNTNNDLNSYLDRLVSVLQPIEDELKARNSTYFGGDHPGMVDFVIWPWAETAKCVSIIHKQKLNFPKEKFVKILTWTRAMKENPAVKETGHDIDIHTRYLSTYITGKVQYDDL